VNKKYFPAVASSSYSAKAAFLSRASRAGNDGKRPGEQAFNQRNGKPMLLALGSVASIPIKGIELQDHDNGVGMQMYRQMRTGADEGVRPSTKWSLSPLQ
jgi:hypothetical protein